MSAKNKPNEIYITRIYDAPVKTVWAAWTDVEQVAKWWGPRGFTLTTHSKDLRAGGHWNYTMHGPDGTDWENRTKYFEVEKYSRLVYDHGANETQPPLFRVTVDFTETKGKTKMEMTMALATPEAAQETKKFIRKAGGDSTWDRLAEHLGKETEQKEIFVINRSFEASRELMFDLWTDPKHVAQWLPPTGMTMKYLRADIKPGGSSLYAMTNGEMTMYGRAAYLEIQRPEYMKYTQEFCDENEKLSRHPMAPTWPATMLTTVKFIEEGPKQTRVNITWEVVGDYTDVEMQTFMQARPGMSQGWGGSFEKLEEYLQKI